ncbi:MAG: hypothetical protein M1835_002682 [Candelina submexicana]|nr:MAG: hypothetical protein M1835_002682 [Candelina submexicana]
MASKYHQPPGERPQTSEMAEEELPTQASRFAPEEEAVRIPSQLLAKKQLTTPSFVQALVSESNELKSQANKLFGTSHYSEAIQEYDKALSSCPNYLEYEIAVLRSNIAACHLRLEDWKAAITAATLSLEALDRLNPPKPTEEVPNLEEIDDETEARINAAQGRSSSSEIEGRSKEDIQRIRAKALMRRGKARTEQGGWAALQGADEGSDYKALSQMPELPAADKKIVQRALATLPPRLEEAKSKEMAEMMGKLKQLGNGILKPFGLSTDNFNMIKDEATGGYSMQFNQGNSSSGGKS